MSERKQAHVAASVNAGMVVGDGKHRRVRLHLKLWGLVLLIVLAVAIVSWAAYEHYHMTTPKTQSSSVTKKAPTNNPLANATPEQKSQYYADEGKYQAAEQSLQKELASTKATTDKLAIYSQQSAVAVQFKQYTDAKNYANEALKLAPNSPQGYVLMAQLAEAQNNNAQAKQYWQQAINHVNSNIPGYNMIIEDYQSQLDALK